MNFTEYQKKQVPMGSHDCVFYQPAGMHFQKGHLHESWIFVAWNPGMWNLSWVHVLQSCKIYAGQDELNLLLQTKGWSTPLYLFKTQVVEHILKPFQQSIYTTSQLNLIVCYAKYISICLLILLNLDNMLFLQHNLVGGFNPSEKY